MSSQREIGERVHSNSRLPDCQTKEPTSSIAQEKCWYISEGRKEDSRSTDKLPDKSCPEGIPDVSDNRARHSRYMRPLPEYARSQLERELDTVGGALWCGRAVHFMVVAAGKVLIKVTP